ncbi:MAG: threonine synthase [SAR202 cluster bacterium]|nr:threonine synthase [SAR202 cluster bacterium]|tara:strand:- start:30175 stop:31236 length:1062 start_codon:yes stop_codon:yes gene_type:complete
MGKGIINKYSEYLPINNKVSNLSIGEGDTPLVKSRSIGRTLGIDSLYFKLEGCNPTGSFKDRGMVIAVAKSLETGNPRLLCASTGNTSASAAAYGAAAGLETIVLVPKGNIAIGKMSQAIAYGARIISINGNFDDSLNIAIKLGEDQSRFTLVNSVNPYRIEGQKTASFELIDELGDAPNYLYIPVGNAGNITAYWKGFKEYFNLGKSTFTPKMMGIQAAGAAPIVQGSPVSNPETIASAIRIGNPASWSTALSARDESGGEIDAVSDDEILNAYKRMAREEGIFCEPASAASVAGLIKHVHKGFNISSKTVVCIITGNGLKDPPIANSLAESPPEEAAPDLIKVMKLIDKRG